MISNGNINDNKSITGQETEWGFGKKTVIMKMNRMFYYITEYVSIFIINETLAWR